MRLETKKYLYDIARAAGLAMEFTAGKTFADYSSDVLLRSAVERQLESVRGLGAAGKNRCVNRNPNQRTFAHHWIPKYSRPWIRRY